jgi:hypothetical protein
VRVGLLSLYFEFNAIYCLAAVRECGLACFLYILNSMPYIAWQLSQHVTGVVFFKKKSQGEELTFDYYNVRVSGAAPQKCFCGTAKCRGYIAGDISVVDRSSDDLLQETASSAEGSKVPNGSTPTWSQF